MAEKKTVTLPDVGDFSDIEIIEILAVVGDEVEEEQSIIVLESDKATMEIPSPHAGTVESLQVSVGDRLNQGDAIAILSVGAGSAKSEAPPQVQEADEPEAAPAEAPTAPAAVAPTEPVAAPTPKSDAAPGKTLRPHPGADSGELAAASTTTMVHASPSIRRYARELGVDLQRVIGSGPKGRIVKSDVKAFVKSAFSGTGPAATPGAALNVSAMPEVDHSRFGEIETVALSRIKKISGAQRAICGSSFHGY